MFGKPIDFLAIGDITTDAFIRLKDAHVNCAIDKTRCEICLKFADKVPFESVTIVKAVGNSANASVAAARLGLRSALVSDIGDDQNGKDCLAQLKKEAVATSYISTHRGTPTNYHYVLWYGDERTILVKHQKYPYQLPHISPPPKWLYLSSLGSHSEAYHEEIIGYLAHHPEVKLAFQPGTFQMQLGTKKLAALYKRSEVLICNVEEAERITGISSGANRSEIKKVLYALHLLGPKIVHVSDGPKGGYVSDARNGRVPLTYFMPIYPDPKPPLERTGAGDSYASTFVAAFAMGKSLEEAVQWGVINSMSVVQYVGAQEGLLDQKAIQSWLAKAPSDFHLRVI